MVANYLGKFLAIWDYKAFSFQWVYPRHTVYQRKFFYDFHKTPFGFIIAISSLN